MKKNMGSVDRIVRVSLAVLIVILMVTGAIEGTLLIILGIVAAIFLLTSTVSFCPLYAPFRISTRGKSV